MLEYVKKIKYLDKRLEELWNNTINPTKFGELNEKEILDRISLLESIRESVLAQAYYLGGAEQVSAFLDRASLEANQSRK